MNLRPNFHSITTRMIAFSLVLLLLASVGRMVLLTGFLRTDMTQLTSAQLLTLANYVARDIDHNIVERRELLERMAGGFSADLLHDPQRLRAWLRERQEINPLFSQGLSVYDAQGVIVAEYPAAPDRTGEPAAGRDCVKQALLGEFVIGRPVSAGDAKVPVLPMAVPVRDATGKVYAAVSGVTALHAPNFLDTLYTTRVGATGGLVVVSPRDKLFVAASDVNLTLRPTPKPGLHMQHDRAMAGFRGTGVDVNARGIEELTAVVSVPSSGWFLVARVPTEEALAPLSRLRRFILENTAFAAVLLVIILVAGLRYLLGPLERAADHADRMSRDEIPFEPLPVQRDDEVGHLTAAFNRVLAKLLESRAELEHMVHHDALTGLPSRKLLTDHMEHALGRAERNGGRVAVLFLDLDGFKPINDELGHEAGDAALRDVAGRLSAALRRDATLARVGGDEFVILLPDLGENAEDVGERVAKRCQDAFLNPFPIRGEARRLGTSIGIAIGGGDCSRDKLLVAADQAMYRAKQQGPGRIVFAQPCAGCSPAPGEASCLVCDPEP